MKLISALLILFVTTATFNLFARDLICEGAYELTLDQLNSELPAAEKVLEKGTPRSFMGGTIGGIVAGGWMLTSQSKNKTWLTPVAALGGVVAGTLVGGLLEKDQKERAAAQALVFKINNLNLAYQILLSAEYVVNQDLNPSSKESLERYGYIQSYVTPTLKRARKNPNITDEEAAQFLVMGDESGEFCNDGVVYTWEKMENWLRK